MQYSLTHTPKKVHYFASIYEYFLFHKELKPGPKALLAVLHAKSYKCKDFRKGKPQAVVSQAELADKLGVTPRAIQYWLDKLCAVEAIKVVCRKHLHMPSLYILLPPPYSPGERLWLKGQEVREELKDVDNDRKGDKENEKSGETNQDSYRGLSPIGNEEP